MESEDIKLLMQRYQTNQLSVSELKRLRAWVETQADEELEIQFQTLWDNYTVADVRNKQICDRVLDNIYMQEARLIVHNRNRMGILCWMMRVAASLFLPLVFLSFFVFYQQKVDYETMMAHSYSVKTEKGERSTLILPDGTKVSLNHSSCLTYQGAFSKEDRRVKLVGEAYFEVTHDAEDRPFVVQTERADIKVLGTIFNVSAYGSGSFFETSLVEGQVEVIPIGSNQKSLFLKPNQKVSWDKQTDQWQVLSTDLWLETAWKRGDIVFRSERLDVIMRDLESYYGVNIHVIGTCPTELFTGSFHEEEVATVLKILQQHYVFDFEKDGRDIRVSF